MQERREYQRFSLNDSIFLRFESQPEKLIKGELFEQNGFKIGVEFIEIDKEIVNNIIDKLRKAILQEIKNKDKL